MTDLPEPQAGMIRRILVSLDSTAPELPALEAAALLAGELQAQLQTLLVEDIDLVRLAGLPFACELDMSSAAVRPLETVAVSRALRQRAQQVRSAVQQTAARARIEWSFHVTRGEIVHETLAASGDAELLIVCRAARIAPRRDRKQAALAAEKQAKPPVMTVYNGLPDDVRVLSIAAALARQLETQLVVVPATSQDHAADEFRSRLESLSQFYQVEITIHSAVTGVTQLVHAARLCKSGWLVVGDVAHSFGQVDLRRLAEQLGQAIVLVRTPASSET